MFMATVSAGNYQVTMGTNWGFDDAMNSHPQQPPSSARPRQAVTITGTRGWNSDPIDLGEGDHGVTYTVANNGLSMSFQASLSQNWAAKRN